MHVLNEHEGTAVYQYYYTKALQVLGFDPSVHNPSAEPSETCWRINSQALEEAGVTCEEIAKKIIELKTLAQSLGDPKAQAQHVDDKFRVFIKDSGFLNKACPKCPAEASEVDFPEKIIVENKEKKLTIRVNSAVLHLLEAHDLTGRKTGLCLDPGLACMVLELGNHNDLNADPSQGWNVNPKSLRGLDITCQFIAEKISAIVAKASGGKHTYDNAVVDDLYKVSEEGHFGMPFDCDLCFDDHSLSDSRSITIQNLKNKLTLQIHGPTLHLLQEHGASGDPYSQYSLDTDLAIKVLNL